MISRDHDKKRTPLQEATTITSPLKLISRIISVNCIDCTSFNTESDKSINLIISDQSISDVSFPDNPATRSILDCSGIGEKWIKETSSLKLYEATRS